MPGIVSNIIGVGQTWQDVSGSRASGVTYYNTTPRPIYVCVTITTGNPGAQSMTVGGGVVASVPSNLTGRMAAVVPPGGGYSVTTASIFLWAELR